MSEDELLPILKANTADIPSLYLVVGGPQRVDIAAKKLDGPGLVSHNREFRIMKDSFKGAEVGIATEYRSN
jgi:uridine phosphorylase